MACRETCVLLLATLGTLHPQAAGQALVEILEHCFNAELPPPDSFTEILVKHLCNVAASSR
jgi:hypothetical protein